MTDLILIFLWGAAHILCAGLGFIPHAAGAGYWILFSLSLLYFIPPALLLYRQIRQKNIRGVKKIRTVCLVWLIATVGMFLLNVLSIGSSAETGNVLYWILILVSAPMICGQIWIVPLFLWACMLTVCLDQLWKHRK